MRLNGNRSFLVQSGSTGSYPDLATLLSETSFNFYKNAAVSAGVAKPVKEIMSTQGGGLKIHSRNE